MKKLSTILAAVAIAAMLGGCATQGGTYVSEKDAVQFKEGKTTEAEVRAKLGAPQSVTTSGGVRTLDYTSVKVETSGASYIPIAGLFLGNSRADETTATYEFNAKGILQKITYSTGGVDSGPVINLKK